MIDYPWNYLLFIFAFLVAYIDSNISSAAAVIFVIDMFIKFLQQEADKIQQQIGNLQ